MLWQARPAAVENPGASAGTAMLQPATMLPLLADA